MKLLDLRRNKKKENQSYLYKEDKELSTLTYIQNFINTV